MSVSVSTVDVWRGQVDDQPGTLSAGLAALTAAGANLEFTVARRDDVDGKSAVYTGPIKGAKQTAAAAKANFRKSAKIYALRVEASDRPGLAADVTGAAGSAGVNITEFFGAVQGKKVVAYFWLESSADAAKVAKALKKI